MAPFLVCWVQGAYRGGGEGQVALVLTPRGLCSRCSLPWYSSVGKWIPDRNRRLTSGRKEKPSPSALPPPHLLDWSWELSSFSLGARGWAGGGEHGAWAREAGSAGSASRTGHGGAAPSGHLTCAAQTPATSPGKGNRVSVGGMLEVLNKCWLPTPCWLRVRLSLQLFLERM